MNVRPLILVVGLLLLSVSGIGCGAARYVLKEGERGVVAIPANHQEWPFKYREQAEKLMAEHFPEGFVIEKEEEFVIGEQLNVQHNTGRQIQLADNVSVSVGSGNTTATATPKTEYRIYYRRK